MRLTIEAWLRLETYFGGPAPRRTGEHLETGRLGGSTGLIHLGGSIKYGQARGCE